MSERWKDVPGYDGWYQASDLGRVRSWRVMYGRGGKDLRCESPHALALKEVRDGYLAVTLRLHSQSFNHRMNRLVLFTFKGGGVDLEACHRNGDRRDNRLVNLYWGTRLENESDKRAHGTLLRGQAHVAAGLTDESVTEMRSLRMGPDRPSYGELGAMYGVSKQTARKAVTGETWTHVPMPDEGAL